MKHISLFSVRWWTLNHLQMKVYILAFIWLKFELALPLHSVCISPTEILHSPMWILLTHTIYHRNQELLPLHWLFHAFNKHTIQHLILNPIVALAMTSTVTSPVFLSDREILVERYLPLTPSLLLSWLLTHIHTGNCTGIMERKVSCASGEWGNSW